MTDRSTRVADGVLERDRLVGFFPALLALTVLAGALEAVAAVVLREPAFGAAAGVTSFLAMGVVVAGRQIRLGHSGRARLALAVTLALVGGLGAYLVPGVPSLGDVVRPAAWSASRPTLVRPRAAGPRGRA